MRRRRSKRPTSMVTARFVRCSYSSSQPSMVHWLSSSIFPCLSLVCRPAMVTPDQISIKEADLDGDGKVFALFLYSIVMRWNICNIRMLDIDQKDMWQKFLSRWGETSLWCLWCPLLSTLSGSSSETVTNNWCKCGYESFSDVGEIRVWFASKILTPCRMHWNAFLIAQIIAKCHSFPNMYGML